MREVRQSEFIGTVNAHPKWRRVRVELKDKTCLRFFWDMDCMAELVYFKTGDTKYYLEAEK